MRVIIAGGRDFSDYDLLKKKCNNIFFQFSQVGIIPVSVNQSRNTIEIICGKAKGADTLGEKFAKEYGLNIRYFPANWDVFGKRAGYLRNEEMAKHAKEDNGVLIAFWDGQSKGTSHMINLANKYGLKVFIVNY